MAKPKIKASVVIATRNEEKTISACVESLLKQNYPKNKYEIIFSDGRSTDKTREIIKRYATSDKRQATSPRIILLDNPKIDSGSGRNIGIKKARGEFIVQLSGHTVADKNLLKVLVGKLEKSADDIAAVGCTHKTPADAGFFEKVFGAVMSSYIGGFGTSQIQSKKEQFAESLSFCAFRKKVLLKVGLNDPAFKVGQDAELNVRIRKAGYKFLYTPKTFVLYHKRSNYWKFAKQMFWYGWGRYKILIKHPEYFSAFKKFLYLGPSILVVGFLLLLGFTLLNIPNSLFSLVLALIFYCGAVIASSASNAKSFTFFLAEFFAFWVMHISYGIGFLYGIFAR